MMKMMRKSSIIKTRTMRGRKDGEKIKEREE